MVLTINYIKISGNLVKFDQMNIISGVKLKQNNMEMSLLKEAVTSLSEFPL